MIPAGGSCSTQQQVAGKKWNVVYRSLQQNFFDEQLKRMKLPEFQDALKERMWGYLPIPAKRYIKEFFYQSSSRTSCSRLSKISSTKI